MTETKHSLFAIVPVIVLLHGLLIHLPKKPTDSTLRAKMFKIWTFDSIVPFIIFRDRFVAV
jgi:hypothetical protein